MKDTENKLFVGNLAYSADATELKDLFSAYGTVLEVSIPSDRATGRPRGFAFVTMETKEEAKAALAADGNEIQGRRIAVNIANSKKHEGGPRFSRGGGDSHGGGNFYGNNDGRRNGGGSRGNMDGGNKGDNSNW